MIIRKQVVVTKEVEQIHEVLCNMCGLSCRGEKDNSEPPYQMGDFLGLIEETVMGGYFSEDFSDGDKYTFSMCEKCLLELFKQFVISPEKEEM